MKTNLKILTIVIAFITLVSMACAIGTPAPTPTNAPTQTALPTYTPPPTYTPFPVPITMTDIPDKVDNYTELDCPSTLDIPAGIKARCFVINISPVAVGIIFSQGNKVVAIAVTWEPTNDAVEEKVAKFIFEQAEIVGWNTDDLTNLTYKLANSPSDTTVNYGSLSAQGSYSETFITVVYGLNSFFKQY